MTEGGFGAAPFLPNVLVDATLAVEVAWGADVTAAYSTWTWTDITGDVRASPGITLKHGRGDEAEFAQPASCNLVLDNSAGGYSLGGRSPNWPNVVKNTPVRVLLDYGGIETALFIGYADSWQPAWNRAASVAEVHLTASGILRRLAQHDAPVLSSLRRRLSTETNAVAYWPLEEGKLATEVRSGIDGHPAMNVNGSVDFAGPTGTFAATLQMPVLKNGGFSATVPPYTFTATTGQQFRCLVSFPENGAGMTDDAIIVRLYLAHESLAAIDIAYGTGGSLKIKAWRRTSAAASSFTSRHNVVTNFGGVDGKDVRLFLELRQVGSDVTYKYGIQEPGASGVVTSGTFAGGAATLDVITGLAIGPDSNLSGLAVGHPVVQNTITGIFDDLSELDAFEGEVTWVRLARIAAENGIESTTYGDGKAFDQITDEMGEQRPESVLTLVKQIQEVDRGIVYDGLNQGGWTLVSRRAIETVEPSVYLDVAAGDLAGILTPIDDDQRLLNRALVSRQDGATAVFEDSSGPLGTGSVGTYDSSVTIPVATDAAAVQYASWLVALGTVEGYRYPSIEIDLAARPDLVPYVRYLKPGRRVDLVNITGAAAQHPDKDVSLLVQGFEQTITPHSWRITVNCTPYGPWSVGVLTNTDGTPVAAFEDDDSLHLDTAGAQLAADAAAGATSLSVATTTGPLWTTNAQDLPFDIEVGGIVVHVTAIAGATSPQTFTVTGVAKNLTAGMGVTMHAPNVLGL